MVILGHLQSKSNSRRIVRYGSKIASIKSASALDFEALATLQLKRQWRKKPLKGDVGVEVTVWYPSKRNDLDPSLLFDVMQKAGIYENDRQIRQYTAFKEWDKLNPRVKVDVYSLED